MKLIVGLGNPGKQYEKTRHNAGFMAVDALAKAHGISDAQWRKHHKANALVVELLLGGVKHLLAKPQTFMNDSGDAVQALLAFHKIDTANLIVAHDELDFPFGVSRITAEASAGGHNGVASIIERIGTKAFTRLRIGVNSDKRGKIPTEKFVLLPFSLFERLKLRSHLTQASDALECLISKNAQECMNKFN
jgi:PTH1 family peptidyl-tRNA hydrolase